MDDYIRIAEFQTYAPGAIGNAIQPLHTRQVVIPDHDLIVNGQLQPSAIGWNDTLANVSWAYLEGTGGYYFPDGGATLHALRETRTDNWKSVNNGQSDTNYSDSYVTMWYDHGANPADAAYEYVLLPNKSSAETAAYADNADITVLANSAQVQAVKERKLGIVAANFWEDETRTVDIITSNKKSSVMVKRTGSDIDVSVSDPTQSNEGTVEIELNVGADEVLSSDPGVTVTQLVPSIKLSVNVDKAAGKSFHVKLRSHETALGSSGQVVIEAERYQSQTALGDYQWSETYDESASGNVAMLSGPVEGTAQVWNTTSRLNYPVQFDSAGTYYVWLRGAGPDPVSDSVYIGLNGTVTTSGNFAIVPNDGVYGWRSVKGDYATRTTIVIPSAGLYTVNLFIREPGAAIDKLLLTKDAGYTPTGVGPATSPILPEAIADTSANRIGQPIDIAFVDREPWRDALNEVSVDGTPLSGSQYTVSAGRVRIASAAFPSAKTYAIVLRATGYPDVTVSQPVTAASPIAPPALQAQTTDNLSGGSIAIKFIDQPDWRQAITNISLDGRRLLNSEYAMTPGKLTIAAGVLTGEAPYEIRIKATGYDDATISQSMRYPFVEKSGRIVLEAERYHSKQARLGQDWVLDTDFAGYTGTGTMLAAPDIGNFYDAQYSTFSPQLNYAVDFPQAGTYYIWSRSYNVDSNADSIHIGLNGRQQTSGQYLFTGGTGAYTWRSGNATNVRRTLEVPAAGINTVNVWFREDGVRLDKFILTRDASYTPSGEGPSEMEFAPVLHADAADNLVGEPVELTFAADASWQAAISGVTVDDIPLSSGQYTVTNGQLAIAANAFDGPGARVYAIGVQAEGYVEATVAQTLREPYGIQDGLVVIEAERAHNNVPSGDYKWEQDDYGSYSGSGAMLANPTTGAAQVWNTASRLDYQVNFDETGTYYVWIRGAGINTNSDSLYVGLDGAVPASGNFAVGSNNGAYEWWKLKGDYVTRTTLTIANTGVHTINLFIREPGMRVDKLILTQNASYAPTGAGPAETEPVPIKYPPLLQSDRSYNVIGYPIEIGFADRADWRTAITEVKLDGTTVDPSKYVISGERLTLSASVFEAGGAGTYTIAIIADGYPDATVSQVIRNPYTVQDGLAVMEAERYHDQVVKGTYSWIEDQSGSGYSGSGVMLAAPTTGSAQVWNTTSHLDYLIDFDSAGTYYVWVRGAGTNGNSDSLYVGLDGTIASSGNTAIIPDNGTYNWRNLQGDYVSRMTLTVDSAGLHTLNLFIREPGAHIDKILLTQNASYTPTGLGPDETES
ncbi:hemoblobin-interacting domain-containing protein [Cohnella fermenti]